MTLWFVKREVSPLVLCSQERVLSIFPPFHFPAKILGLLCVKTLRVHIPEFSLSHLIFLPFIFLPIIMLLKGGEIEGRENENPELGGLDGFVKIRVHSWFLFAPPYYFGE